MDGAGSRPPPPVCVSDVLLDVDRLQHLRLQAPELRVLSSPQSLAALALELTLPRLPRKSLGLLVPPVYF
jgi:hypothetical protein